ncbi:uncharacterized protein LOC119603708 [Lucilia sericata]|uniref:uncharacterized protein LOC119603708 n=1 Tax=Lucilia sericata TaxID=13632 RepID=UPI0018A8672E|nr:uncharacterized protein LOC119603708 [Lucilia sericata]XP_037811771.1 uncharacterized protein LOC119603708 [Lucilia sericata]XP_037811772.1 uncharacterized protein LOC119603708 [Lucilia sericata]
MESNHYLDSLRDISESQLEALLRYDSPPETPAELANPIQRDFNKNNVLDSYNSRIHDNRESFFSHLDSEIDFSIFHRDSPNLQWSLSAINIQSNNNDDSVIATTFNTDEISNISIGDNNRNHQVPQKVHFLQFDTNEQRTLTTKPCNSFGQYRKQESLQKLNSLQSCALNEKRPDDFKEIDNILKNIDFENIPNVEILGHSFYDPIRIQRKSLTQLEHKKSLQEQIIASCPASIGELHPYSFSENFCSENINLTELNNIHLRELSIRDDNQDIPFDDNFCEIDGIFETLNFEEISESSSYVPRQSQNEVHSNEKHPTQVKIPGSLSIPFSVRQLYEIVTTKYSDFAFIYALSSQLCQDRVPMECFVTLKMGLLLSLVSIGNNVDRPPIPIVAMTNDTYMTDYLMTNIGQLGSRFLGSVDDVKSFSSSNWIEADSILLARGGVYYAGDWTRIKLRKAETIFKNIECSSVVVEKSTVNYPLETAIWTHWRSFKHGSKDQQMFNKFLKIFGLPIFVSDDNHEALVDYTLEQASIRIFESTVDHLSINEDDMRNFLVSVSQNEVNLTPEAALLLKNYFVASRSSREDCLTKQSYVMLKQFAESFAKLSMRKEVLLDDALAAIIMCEHFIENVFSSTPDPDNSPPHFGSFSFVGTVDEYCMRFKEWLNSYIDQYVKE